MTPAEFTKWLRDPTAQVAVLAEIEFAYESGGLPATGTIYLADCAYVTRPTDTPANQRYRDVISSAPEFERSIDLKTMGGRGILSVGSLTLDNADGQISFLLDDIIDGRDVRFYIGDKRWARVDFRLAGIATVASVKTARDVALTIALRDKGFLLDAQLVGDTIATGPNAGKVKPLLFGEILNLDVGPYMLDDVALTYVMNSYALTDFDNVGANQPGWVHDVRDKGGSLDSGVIATSTPANLTANAATDTLTQAAHTLSANDVIFWVPTTGTSLPTGLLAFTQYWVIAAGLTVNDFRLSLTRGGAAIDITGTATVGNFQLIRRRFYIDAPNAVLQLSSSPAGRVTVDLRAVDAALTMADAAPHQAMLYILQHYTKLTASEYDSTAISAMAATEAGSRRWGRAILDRANVLDVFDDLSLVVGAWYAPNASGVLSIGSFGLASLDVQTSVDTITTDDLYDDLDVENMVLPFGKITVDYDRNVVVQTDGLLDTVSAANRSKWGQPFQKRLAFTDPPGADYVNDWWNYHKSAIDSQPVPTCASGSTSAAVCANALSGNFKPWTRIYRGRVGLDKYALNPGDCVTLTYPRYGASAGIKCRVASVKPQLSDKVVDVVLVRQVTPDYTTASHP